ncbi:hypothetical protein C9374_000281 [Naegleria lovaniensis]|uniref:F-box domain-containing protein n=1 Tax=Naegleria lovaniensis TaxID=51637 RepID=A0AA88KTU9_NAELO|nr:uncharacterized protein C9374_000281 [Naegleria lovaniensis]KAG2388842.1 hypothetical protein C9374_000281 [Naegleria lovaniensis]
MGNSHHGATSSSIVDHGSHHVVEQQQQQQHGHTDSKINHSESSSSSNHDRNAHCSRKSTIRRVSNSVFSKLKRTWESGREQGSNMMKATSLSIFRNDDHEQDMKTIELSTEFIVYRRSFYERHDEYTNMFEQKNCKLLNTQYITGDIIEMIKSYLPLQDCCSLALTCQLTWLYWFGDEQFWWKRLKRTQIMTHFVKYRPFLSSHIHVRDWKELCFHIKYNCQWKHMECQVVQFFTPHMESTTRNSVPVHEFFYMCKVDTEHEEIQQMTTIEHSHVLVSLNGHTYQSKFGKLANDSHLKEGHGATCVLLINVGYNGNSTNAFKIKEMFSKYCDRVRFLILVYNYTKTENQEEVGKSFSHSLNTREVEFWRQQSYLFNTPYLEVLEDQRFSIHRNKLIGMLKKMHAWNVLNQVGRRGSTEASKMLETFLLSIRQDFQHA